MMQYQKKSDSEGEKNQTFWKSLKKKSKAIMP